MKILLIEDELDLALSINNLLSSKGWECSIARSVERAFELLEKEIFDVCILDLILGRDLGKKILPVLKHMGIPTIVLTVIDDPKEKVECLRAGADDYLTKPFYPEELIARIEAVLRRRLGLRDNVIKYYDLEVDFSSLEVKAGNHKLFLPKKQAMILIKLLENAEKVIPYQILLRYAWDSNEEISLESLRTHVYNLRKILKSYGYTILSYPGVGYMIKKQED